MNVKLLDAKLLNALPTVIPAVEYSAAIPATETTPEIPEIQAQPKTYIFKATVFTQAAFAPEGKFIQADDIEVTVESSEESVVYAAVGIEAQKIIDNYNNLT